MKRYGSLEYMALGKTDINPRMRRFTGKMADTGIGLTILERQEIDPKSTTRIASTAFGCSRSERWGKIGNPIVKRVDGTKGEMMMDRPINNIAT